MRTRLLLLASLAALVTALLTLRAPRARAGDREMETLLVDMSPNGTPGGHACFTRIRRTFAADYTTLHGRGETATRAAVHDAEGDFMAWQPAALAPLKEAHGDLRYDAVVLIDCRPEARRADVLVYESGDAVARVRWRDMALEPTDITWLAKSLVRLCWVGFSP